MSTPPEGVGLLDNREHSVLMKNFEKFCLLFEVYHCGRDVILVL